MIRAGLLGLGLLTGAAIGLALGVRVQDVREFSPGGRKALFDPAGPDRTLCRHPATSVFQGGIQQGGIFGLHRNPGCQRLCLSRRLPGLCPRFGNRLNQAEPDTNGQHANHQHRQ